MLITLALSLAMQTTPLTIEVRGVPPATPSSTTTATLDAGRALFTIRCQMCHGKAGDADTPMGKAMKPAPARFSDGVWQRTTTDDDIRQIITLGGAALKKSPAMPAAKNLKPEELDALVAFVRSLRAPHGSARVTVTTKSGAVVVGNANADASGVARVVVNVDGVVGAVGVDSAGRGCVVDVVSGAVAVCVSK